MGRLPLLEDFPSNVILSIVPPPNNDPPTNVLVLLHGLGDTRDAFTHLGKQMSLPETVCISVQGPHRLLDLGGFHWGDDIIFDSASGGLDVDAGFKQAVAMLKGLVVDDVIEKCGYKAREVFLLGFGQGGMAALSVAVEMHQNFRDPASAELGGVISIGGPMPSESPPSLINKCKTPVLICAGIDQSSVTPTAESRLNHVFEHVEVARYRKPGDSMPSNRDEMMPIMKFFSKRLRSTKGVPKGSVEIV
ncbi:MAG: hypothetical protein FE78DRAFT_77951 [Acidomyces sp. 'richmondensis']|nr:MAG: hypothetical protein FE78DRAFT_77951 [Acidomyces sp. 'richmondensis']